MLVQAATEEPSTHMANINQHAQQALDPFALAVAQWQPAIDDFERLFRRDASATSAMETFIEKNRPPTAQRCSQRKAIIILENSALATNYPPQTQALSEDIT